MSVIKKFEGKFPILFSIAVLVLFDVIALAIGLILGNLMTVDGYYQKFAVSEFAAAGVSVILLIISGKSKSVMKSRKGFFKSLWVGAYEIVLIGFAFVSVLAEYSTENFLPVKDIIVFVACMILVGVSEEVLFRGVIADSIINKYGKDRKGIILAVTVSGIIFGLAHLSNIFYADINPLGVCVQVVQAASLGIFFGAVYMRTHNIFAVIFLHSAMDFVSLSASGLWGVGTVESSIGELSVLNLISVIVYLIPAIFIMRFSKLDEYIAERNSVE